MEIENVNMVALKLIHVLFSQGLISSEVYRKIMSHYGEAVDSINNS